MYDSLCHGKQSDKNAFVTTEQEDKEDKETGDA